MKHLTIIYWSGTGNTKLMANSIEDGAKEKNIKVTKLNVSQATPDDITNCDILALGSPAMGCETIEECEMEPFIDSISDLVSGKSIVLFGSYDWGTGEWMETWKEKMDSYGASVLNTLIVQNTPEGKSLEECINFGRSL